MVIIKPAIFEFMEAIGFVKALIIIQGLYRIVENCGTEDVADFLEINK